MKLSKSLTVTCGVGNTLARIFSTAGLFSPRDMFSKVWR